MFFAHLLKSSNKFLYITGQFIVDLLICLCFHVVADVSMAK
jgi:hypothetical protein